MNNGDFNAMKRGYLNSDFELFHLKDMKNLQFEYHYHDFYKILIFMAGNVIYLIEGKAYRLKPWDILFINSSEIHKPVIDPKTLYERIIIWVNPCFLENHGKDCDLFTCFRLASERNNNLLRISGYGLNHFQAVLASLEKECNGNDFGYIILKNSLFLQLLVIMTREMLGTGFNEGLDDIKSDKSIQGILDYINNNISADLSVDTLASKFFINRYYLMHKFKRQTGYSLHKYILHKRLFIADSMIRNGVPTSEACEKSGFNDYSNFSRAYKKLFGVSPKQRKEKL